MDLRRIRAKRDLANTRAIRFRVQVALHAWSCPDCKANFPRVTHTQARVRYIKCRDCGKKGKLVVS